MKDKSKKSTYSTTFGVDPKFVDNSKLILLDLVLRLGIRAKGNKIY